MIKIILITLIIFHAETRKAYELWKARLQQALGKRTMTSYRLHTRAFVLTCCPEGPFIDAPCGAFWEEDMDERNSTRARILGVLIQDARRHAGRTLEECARVVNLTPEQFGEAERGRRVVSLPQLEVLAIFLGVPMAHFWGSHTLSDGQEHDYGDVLALRHRIVGGLLKQARLDAGRSQEEVAQRIGEDSATVQGYETGRVEIPFLQLEEMGRYLDVSVDYFLDGRRGPFGRHEAQQEVDRHLQELPPDVREFVSRPVNIAYLQTAMRLSEMDAEQLRNIAAGILEITY